MTNFAAITPHPPIAIPEIGGEEIKKIPRTIQAFQKLGEKFTALETETVLVVSPHGQLSPDVFNLGGSLTMSGDFENFGHPEINFSFSGNPKLARKIIEKAAQEKIPCRTIDYPFLDHGTLVPLYFLTKRQKTTTKLLPVFFSGLSASKHFSFGQTLGQAIKAGDEKIALVASGDLSHCLSIDAPGGFSPQGKIFDETLIKLIQEKKWKEIASLDPGLIEEAGECGWRSIVILLGALSIINKNFSLDILSYEAPFGVGYLTAEAEL